MDYKEFETLIKSLNENSNIKELYDNVQNSFKESFDKANLEQIDYLNSELEKYQNIEKENKPNNSRLARFANDIVKKYTDSNVDLDFSKLNYSSLDNFDKSIVKQLSDKNVQIREQKQENKEPERKIGIPY